LVLKTLLAQAGIVPTLVENGRQALEAWEGQHWDVILMDIQMPVMDGVEATRAIREREAVTQRPRTPILAVTANAMTHQVAEYRAAGMDGMVPKPIDVAALFQAMEQALEPVSDGDDSREASAA
jgi:CheY-like chemotaxis protein